MTTKELKSIDTSEFLTVEEAAEFLGLKESAIRNYLSLGKLITYKLKSLTLLKLEDVKNWKKDKSRK
jgi:excisionase family DNA binding protein